jgi:hypothetical protein
MALQLASHAAAPVPCTCPAAAPCLLCTAMLVRQEQSMPSEADEEHARCFAVVSLLLAAVPDADGDRRRAALQAFVEAGDSGMASGLVAHDADTRDPIGRFALDAQLRGKRRSEGRPRAGAREHAALPDRARRRLCARVPRV